MVGILADVLCRSEVSTFPTSSVAKGIFLCDFGPATVLQRYHS